MGSNAQQTDAFQLPFPVPHVRWVDITYTTTAETKIVKVPSGATIKDVYASVQTAFNDSGTDLIKVQRSGQSAGELASIDGSTIGLVRGTALATAADAVQRMGADTDITVQYVGQNANSSAGAARVFVEYWPPNQ